MLLKYSFGTFIKVGIFNLIWTSLIGYERFYSYVQQFSSHWLFNTYFNFAFIQVCVVKLKMDKDRKKIIERRAAGRAAKQGKDKEKFTAMDTSA